MHATLKHFPLFVKPHEGISPKYQLNFQYLMRFILYEASTKLLRLGLNVDFSFQVA